MRVLIPDIDIWRCAALMIHNHGDEAELEAAAIADDFLSKGNIEAQHVRLRIVKGIDELRAVKPGEAKNWHMCGRHASKNVDLLCVIDTTRGSAMRALLMITAVCC